LPSFQLPLALSLSVKLMSDPAFCGGPLPKTGTTPDSTSPRGWRIFRCGIAPRR
jgi:hypothetical protein